jgi:hypothetical protein
MFNEKALTIANRNARRQQKGGGMDELDRAAEREGSAERAAKQDAAYQRGSAEVLNAARERGAEHYLVGYSMFEGMV